MHDIWNPWHGCVKCSEGCQHCYMYYLDSLREKNGADIYRTKAGFRYPLSKDRQGHYKVKSGETLRVCMTSDFFLEEADPWREDAWDIIRQRPDVKFFLLTKRPQRVADHLPKDWGNGWDSLIGLPRKPSYSVSFLHRIFLLSSPHTIILDISD